MKKIAVLFLIGLAFIGCNIEPKDNHTPSTPIVPDPNDPLTSDPIDPVDSAFWFGEIYEELIERIGEILSDDYISEPDDGIATCQDVCDAINEKWETSLTPETGTEMQVADCEYLLEVFDILHNDLTTYGDSEYATKQILDITAVNDAINNLWKPASMYVAVGGKNIAYSTDGIDWTIIEVGPATWQSVTYGDGKYVAVGGKNIAYSTDGIDWTMIEVGPATWQSVAYGDGKYVATGGKNIAYSTDGIDWTMIEVGPASWQSVTYGNGKFIAVGSGTIANKDFKNVAYSTDGIDWTPINVGTYNYWCVTYGNGTFVMSGIYDTAYSTDGIKWKQVSTIYGVYDIAYGNGKFITIRNYGGVSSTDGIEWNQTDAIPGTTEWRGITYGNGKFVTAGRGGNNGNTAYSTDGIVWTIITTTNTVQWYGITCDGERGI